MTYRLQGDCTTAVLIRQKTVNNSMNDQDSYKLINYYLSLHNKVFSSSSQRLAYERGILTALLMYLMRDDFHVKKVINRKINELRKYKT